MTNEAKCPKCQTVMIPNKNPNLVLPDGEPDKFDLDIQKGLRGIVDCPKCKYSMIVRTHLGDQRNKAMLPESWLTEDEKAVNAETKLNEIPREHWGKVRADLMEFFVNDKYKEKHNVVKLTTYYDGQLCLNESNIKAALNYEQKKAEKVLYDIKACSVNEYEGLPDFLFVEKGNNDIIFFV